MSEWKKDILNYLILKLLSHICPQGNKPHNFSVRYPQHHFKINLKGYEWVHTNFKSFFICPKKTGFKITIIFIMNNKTNNK